MLVIDALVRLVSARPWEKSLAGTWDLVVRQGRRGAHDLRVHLAKGESPAVEDRLPDPKQEIASLAYKRALELSIELGHSVGRASLAAFASDQPDLGESMHKLARAADRLQRVLFRYHRDEYSSKGKRRDKKDVVNKWGAYIGCLLELDREGRGHGFQSPASHAQVWLVAENKKSTVEEVLECTRGNATRLAHYTEVKNKLILSTTELVVWIKEKDGRINYEVIPRKSERQRSDTDQGDRPLLRLASEVLDPRSDSPRSSTQREPPDYELFEHGLRWHDPEAGPVTIATWDPTAATGKRLEADSE